MNAHPSNTNGLLTEEPDISLVVPCYNEADVLRNTALRLIKEFTDREVALELVLVDNGSEDETGQIIEQLIQEGYPVVKETVRVNIGYGNGILQGLKVCRGRFIGFIAADGQVDAHDVGKLYEIAANARHPHLVKVRRRFRMDGFKRKIVSIIYNLLTTLLFGNLGSIDINGNPKILPAEYLKRMNLQSQDWFLDAEVMIKAKRLGLEVFEMNVIAQMREGGQSNVRVTTIQEFLINLLRYRFAPGTALELPPVSVPERGTILDQGT
jgi:glycosyltransferase involved in cell wall biosynthesis